MRRTQDKTRLKIKQRKIDRIDPLTELRELKEQELRSINGGACALIGGEQC